MIELIPEDEDESISDFVRPIYISLVNSLNEHDLPYDVAFVVWQHLTMELSAWGVTAEDLHAALELYATLGARRRVHAPGHA